MSISGRPIDNVYVKSSWSMSISGRPIDNVYVKSSWSMSNFFKCVYNVQCGLCKIEIGL